MCSSVKLELVGIRRAGDCLLGWDFFVGSFVELELADVECVRVCFSGCDVLMGSSVEVELAGVEFVSNCSSWKRDLFTDGVFELYMLATRYSTTLYLCD